MIGMSWTTAPALAAGVVVVRPATAGVACVAPAGTLLAAAPAPAEGTRVPSARLRALPFGIAAEARHAGTDENDVQNKSTLGIHPPGRSLS